MTAADLRARHGEVGDGGTGGVVAGRLKQGGAVGVAAPCGEGLGQSVVFYSFILQGGSTYKRSVGSFCMKAFEFLFMSWKNVSKNHKKNTILVLN